MPGDEQRHIFGDGVGEVQERRSGRRRPTEHQNLRSVGLHVLLHLAQGSHGVQSEGVRLSLGWRSPVDFCVSGRVGEVLVLKIIRDWEEESYSEWKKLLKLVQNFWQKYNNSEM